MKMTQEDRDEWVAALRDGSYKQGKGRLMTLLGDGSVEACCLGVLCDLQAKKGILRKGEVLRNNSQWDFDGLPLYSKGWYAFENALLGNDSNSGVLPYSMELRFSVTVPNFIPAKVIAEVSPTRLKGYFLNPRRSSANIFSFSFSFLNDALGLSFPEIADVVERVVGIVPSYLLEPTENQP